MSDQPQGWSHLPGIFQGLAASAIGAACAPLVPYCWTFFASGTPPEWLLNIGQNSIGLAIIAGGLALGSYHISAIHRHKTAMAEGDRLSIYVAQLEGDDKRGTIRRSIIDTIIKEIGRKSVEVIPAGVLLRLDLTVSDDVANLNAAKFGRRILEANGGDLLIWGQAYESGKGRVVDLRFVSKAEGLMEGRFEISNKLLLKEDFIKEMGSALAAVAIVSSRPTIDDVGNYIANRVAPMAQKLSRLLESHARMPDENRLQMLMAYGLIQNAVAKECGLSEPSYRAVSAFREALDIAIRKMLATDRDRLRANLGNALLDLGEIVGEAELFEEAITIFRVVLTGLSQGNATFLWAGIQNNLGAALMNYSDLEADSGGSKLKESISAFQAALETITQAAMLPLWATLQTNLGVALAKLGERESRAELIEEAIVGYRSVLSVVAQERYPALWATAQVNLGYSLFRLGAMNLNFDLYNEAAAAYREALKEMTQLASSYLRAKVDVNLAGVLGAIGGYKNEMEAVSLCRKALSELTINRSSLDWTHAHANLAAALRSIGERNGDAGILREAVEHYREVFKELTPKRSLIEYAKIKTGLGMTLQSLGELTRGAELDEAIVCYRDIIEKMAHVRAPLILGMVQWQLGKALRLLGERDGGADLFEEAVKACNEALRELTFVNLPQLSKWIEDDRLYTKYLIAHRDQNAGSKYNPKRNSLCPCGSGIKYKHCHGKMK